MALSGSYEYYPIIIAGVPLFLDPDEISFGSQESKDIMVQNEGRTTLTAVKRQVTFTIPGLTSQQSNAFNLLKENEMKAIIYGTKTFSDTLIGTFLLGKSYVSDVTPSAAYSSYGLNIHKEYQVVFNSSVFT